MKQKTNSKKLSKKQIQEQINIIFSTKPFPSQKQIKKAKRLAMSKNIKLGKMKKQFCKKCFTFFTPNNSEVRIKKPLKIIKCKNCNKISRYKII
jgi:RNase P subunit RPR2